MPVNTGKNFCHQTKPYNTLDKVIPYYAYNLMNGNKKENVQQKYTPSEYHQDLRHMLKYSTNASVNLSPIIFEASGKSPG